jgi:High potential iron-sulfur protein
MGRPTILETAVTRRVLVKNLAIAAGTIGVALLPARWLPAAEAARLDVKDPAAVKVGYVENANQVDVKKFPSYAKGSTCENCLLLQGTDGPGYRPCTLFPGKLVAVAGWCSGWTAEI